VEKKEEDIHTIIHDVGDMHAASRAATQNSHVVLRSPHHLLAQRVREDKIENRARHLWNAARQATTHHQSRRFKTSANMLGASIKIVLTRWTLFTHFWVQVHRRDEPDAD